MAKPIQRVLPKPEEQETELDRLCAGSDEGVPSARPKQRARPEPKPEDTDTEPPTEDADDATEPPSEEEQRRKDDDIELEPTSMVDSEAEAAAEAAALQVPCARPKQRARPAMKSVEEIEAEKQLEAIYRREARSDNGKQHSAACDDTSPESAGEQDLRRSPQAGRSKAMARPRQRPEEDVLHDFPDKRPRLEEANQDHIPCARPKQRARNNQEIRFRFLGTGT
ncbi:unnamed protein product [Effrenium voratum]|uniref:Uncharacterized protein n=1 Tax=Effrenium voratum TaxID=2562239 RepID=A0AA36MLX2_9DINO|nr:unnamed protein product [Effrenium voratum]CAJ1435636.1 unnamed protein product [Effrenium voratum]